VAGPSAKPVGQQAHRHGQENGDVYLYGGTPGGWGKIGGPGIKFA
jgi:hypothetical protein